MSYIYFEVSALIMLVVFLSHIKLKRIIRNTNNRFFMLFAVVAVCSIAMDIISTLIFANQQRFSELECAIVLVVLRTIRLFIPYLLLLYVQSMMGWLTRKHVVAVSLMSIPFIVMLLVVVLNPVTGALSYFDSSGRLVRGKNYMAMYVYSMVYLLICFAFTCVNGRQINRKKRLVVWEIIAISTLGMVGQIVLKDIMLSGFGVALSVMVLFLTIQNPSEKIDALTGVYQMAGLKDVLENYCNARREIWVITVALDNIKQINHVFGMHMGDQVIIRLANRLQKSVGTERTFRFAGDKFAVILFNEKEYYLTLNKINEHFMDTVRIGSADVKISACICGFPALRCFGEPDKLISLMDYTISEAKRAGTGIVVEANSEIVGQFNRHREIEEYLFTAAEKNLFQVYYQPIYSTKLGRFVSAEALVRLKHPTMGMISPAEFIPIAESSGQVNSIDRCAFEKVCSFFSANPNMQKCISSVKFNISPADFLGAGLSSRIEKKIHEYGLSPEFFQFEITETAATIYGEELKDWVEAIKKMGAGLCLDDFGSGYANLDCVVKVPFDVVKIDRSMLLAAMKSKQAKTLYENVFSGMTALGFEVVTEGAETREQIDFLKELGVEYIQGFYYSKPLCESDFIKLFQNSEDLLCV